MAVIPKVAYNFNEGTSGTTIRNFTEEDFDAAGVSLTVAASARVGNEAQFDGVASVMSKETFTFFDAISALGISMGIKPEASTGVDYILQATGVMQIIWDGTTMTFSLTTDTATYTVSNDVTSIATGTYIDIQIQWSSNVLNMMVDGVDQTTAATVGSTNTVGPTLFIGANVAADFGQFDLNEIKFFAEAVSDTIMTSHRNNVNGILCTNETLHGLDEGDLICSRDGTGTDIRTAIVSFVQSTAIFRFYPLTDFTRNGAIYQKCGHLWDAARQQVMVIDDDPSIKIYHDQDDTSTLKATADQIFRLDEDGLIRTFDTKTANYTVLAVDLGLFADLSGGIFTITLEASPVDFKEIRIVDIGGDAATNNLTIDGNGNNINGESTYVMNKNFQGGVFIFNGADWNILNNINIMGNDWFFDVSAGNISGHEALVIDGHNPASAVGTEDVNELGTSLVYLAAAELMDVTSSNAADTSAGTGARTVLMSGLNSSHVEISETIIMNGTANVRSVNSYLRVHTLLVLTAGSGEDNAGNIKATAVVALDPQCRMEPAESISKMSNFTVPASKELYIFDIEFNTSISLGGGSPAYSLTEFKVWYKELGVSADAPWVCLGSRQLYGSTEQSGVMSLKVNKILTAETDFRVDAACTVAIQTNATAKCVLYDV